MYTNADITIYLYKKEGKTDTFERLVVKNVYLEDTRQSSFLKTGQRNSSNALVIIPITNLNKLIKFTQGKDFIVKGTVDLEINSTDQAIISKKLAELKALDTCMTIVSVDEKLYGSRSVQHYELSCK